jgi:hypothetical protein
VLSFSMVVTEVGIVTFGEVSSCRRECQLREKKKGERILPYIPEKRVCALVAVFGRLGYIWVWDSQPPAKPLHPPSALNHSSSRDVATEVVASQEWQT